MLLFLIIYMANIWRLINGKLVEANSPEDIADRQKDARVIVDPAIMNEQRRLENRDRYIEETARSIDNHIHVAESKAATFRKLIEDYSAFENYLRFKMPSGPDDDSTLILSSIHGPSEADWRETLSELRVGEMQSIDFAETQKLARQALAESISTEGADRLSSAILNLAYKYEYLLQTHAARLENLKSIYNLLSEGSQNTALLRTYGLKYAEYEEEEGDLKRLAQAKDFLSKKRADQLHLFNS